MLKTILATLIMFSTTSLPAQEIDESARVKFKNANTPAGVDEHRVLWRARLDGYSLGRRVDVGPDGTLYTSNLERLYAFTPTGELLWTVEGAGGGRPVTFGDDGTIYTGGFLVSAVNPDGTLKWQFANPRPGLDLAAGPNIGPDGNIYAAQDVDGDSNALGVFSLDPEGNLRWSTGMEYPIISLRGPSYTDILFDTDRMYITIYRRLSRPPTIRTYSYDGDLMWYTGDMPLAIGGPPQLHPDGNLIVNWAQIGVQSLSEDGDLQWIEEHPMDGQLLLTPDIGADGTVYVADWSGPDWWALNGQGSTLWLGPQPGYDMMGDFAVTPDQNQLVATGSDTFGVPSWVRGYDANGTGEFLWQVDLHIENGLNEQGGSLGTFSNDSRTAYFVSSFPGDADYGYIYAIDISLDLDCDGDGVLDINDNCVCGFNPDQTDSDGDGIGDVCDPFNLPDSCVDALPICPGTVLGNSIGATNDGRSTCSPNGAINRDVWYEYAPVTSGSVTIDGAGSQYSFYLSAHTGCPGTIQNQIACDFDNSSGLWPRLDFDVVAGETYYIRVNGFNAVEMESFQLTLTGPGCEPAPPIADTISAQTPQNTDVEITLSAFDDGIPVGTLMYMVHTLPYYGTLVETSTGFTINDVPYLLDSDRVTYNPDTYYQGTDTFIFSADDGGDWPNGGVSNLAGVQIEVAGPEPIYEFLFDDTDPGFETTGEWAFGQPTGQGTQSFDPTSGFTGVNVYGYNLNGDYTDDMPERYLTTTPMNFTGIQDVRVRFQKWLGIETALFDHAAIQVRSEDSNWRVVWQHTVLENLRTSDWEQVEYDISAFADGKHSVQLRWVMGTTDSLITYPGWNIDDIEFIGLIPVVDCEPDFTADGVLDFFDISSFLNSFTSAEPSADLDHNGDWDFFDISAFLNAFSTGCP